MPNFNGTSYICFCAKLRLVLALVQEIDLLKGCDASKWEQTNLGGSTPLASSPANVLMQETCVFVHIPYISSEMNC